jgi:hypothetical protein
MPLGLGVKGTAVAADIDAIMVRFLAALPPARGATRAGARLWKPGDTRKLIGYEDVAFTALMRVAQTSHAGGLLRFFLPSTLPSLVDWNGRHGWHESWQSKPHSIAFGSDWLGNLLLLDPRRGPNGERRVAFLDLASGAYDIGSDLAEFFDCLPDTWETTFFKRLHDEYLAAGGQAPGIGECVGYINPPVVGGDPEDVTNMKVVNLEGEVSRAGHLHDRFGALPIRTKLARLVRS